MSQNYLLAKEIISRKSRQSLFYLSQNLLGYTDVNAHAHGKLVEVLESKSKRKLIIMPRGSLKSSLACVAFPIWLLLNNPNERILIDSELYTNSKNFLREITAHLESPIFTAIFGKFKGDVWNSDEIIIKQRTKVFKEGSITVGGIGTTKVGQHYTTIIGDDYCSPNNTNTIENAQKVIQHYRYNTSILEPNGTYVVIGTRYAETDLYQHIIDNEIEFKESA